jgi:hypothetical protein
MANPPALHAGRGTGLFLWLAQAASDQGLHSSRVRFDITDEIEEMMATIRGDRI